MTDESLERSKSFRRLKANLIAQIPRVPNDRTSLQILQSQSPTDLLIVYLSWRLRHVESRPRKVTGHHRILRHPSYLSLKSNVQAFLSAVEAGNDLAPYLSLKAHSHGFVVNGQQPSTDWEHKDFLLNTKGLHHFHLGTKLEPKGHMARTNEVLFAFVEPNSFDILDLFDHTVFEASGTGMTAERQRIWSYYHRHQLRKAQPGTAYIGGYGGLGITMAGTPALVTVQAIKHVEIIKRHDPVLDTPEFHAKLWGLSKLPKNRILHWHYKHLTLGLLDTRSKKFFPLSDTV